MAELDPAIESIVLPDSLLENDPHPGIIYMRSSNDSWLAHAAKGNMSRAVVQAAVLSPAQRSLLIWGARSDHDDYYTHADSACADSLPDLDTFPGEDDVRLGELWTKRLAAFTPAKGWHITGFGIDVIEVILDEGKQTSGAPPQTEPSEIIGPII